MKLLKKYVKVIGEKEDVHSVTARSLSVVTLCFITGRQLAVRSCYVILITISAICSHLRFKGQGLFCILGSVLITLSHTANIRTELRTEQTGAFVSNSLIFNRLFPYLSFLAALGAFIHSFIHSFTHRTNAL